MLELETIMPLFPSGACILEIGGGTGRQALELLRRGFQVTAIDLASSSYPAHRAAVLGSTAHVFALEPAR
jgi:ubiquinone/menaquinone biosynthesis C-methylase UbiE